MKIKDRNTINTSQYSFIRTGHEKKKNLILLNPVCEIDNIFIKVFV